MSPIKHYGDITKLNGADLPLVDIITGGSPCQDLSVAGKREGLAGERSGLFMEQMRIVREMRDESFRQLSMRGADVDIRRIQPRYMVWENVPGAFSSNNGEDFRVVLEEIARIKDKTATIPRPDKGKWSYSGCILGDGWSIAWRLHDAQFWGVPQRRKRISLVADFAGESAPEILFERNGVSGDSEQSEQTRKEVAGDIRGSVTESDSAFTLKIRGGCERDSSGKRAGKGALVQTEKSGTLGVSQDQTLITVEPVLLESNQNHATVQTNGISTALPASMGMGGGYIPMVTDKCLNSWDVQSKHIQPEDGIAEALYSGECRYGGGESYVMQETTCYGLDRASFNQGKNAKFNFSIDEEVAPSLVARGPGGGTSETVGSLCARDYKGVGNQYVNEGKVIVQKTRTSSK